MRVHSGGEYGRWQEEEGVFMQGEKRAHKSRKNRRDG